MPIAGRRVVVTREPERAGPLIDALRAAGAEPVLIPAIATEPPRDGGEALDRALATSGRFDWLLFTSAAAVRAVGRRADAGVRVGVVGSATATAAGAGGIDVSVVAPEGDSSAAGLARTLLEDDPGPRTALVPASDIARPELPAALRAAGWTVDVVEAYRTVVVPVDDAAAELASGCDAIIFMSPSAVEAWFDRHLPSVVVSIGPTTSAAVRAGGARRVVEAAERSTDGVLAALAAAFSG